MKRVYVILLRGKFSYFGKLRIESCILYWKKTVEGSDLFLEVNVILVLLLFWWLCF